MRKNIIFTDRDGVINRDSEDYIKNWNEFEFLPGSKEAIVHLNRHGFEVIVITNQSMINRHIAPRADLEYIFERMSAEVVAAGGSFLDIFFCPHHPDENCPCRKPRPGMILSAAQKYGIDLQTACMIGDSATDIECGINAGCGRTILVQTGSGPSALHQLTRRQIKPDFIAADLADAARRIVSG